jgi:2-iminobutanoate/2-iminopropanoate deaminase
MKLRFATTAALLTIAAISLAADSGRKHITLPRPAGFSGLPFSDGVRVGDTLYIGGHIGLDAKTGQPPASAEEEARMAMDMTKQTLEAAGMSMDDLVSVEVHCSDITLYDTFNGVYKNYFRGEYPARAFLGAGKLLRGGRFEITGIAVKKQP